MHSAAHLQVLGCTKVGKPLQPCHSHLPGFTLQGNSNKFGNDICSSPTLTDSCNTNKFTANSYEELQSHCSDKWDHILLFLYWALCLHPKGPKVAKVHILIPKIHNHLNSLSTLESMSGKQRWWGIRVHCGSTAQSCLLMESYFHVFICTEEFSATYTEFENPLMPH